MRKLILGPRYQMTDQEMEDLRKQIDFLLAEAGFEPEEMEILIEEMPEPKGKG